MRRIAGGLVMIVGVATLIMGCNSAHLPLRPDPGATGYAMCGPYSVQRFVYPNAVVERAAVEAMTDMKIHTVKRTPKADGVCFRGFMYDGRYVLLTVEPEGPNSIVSIMIDVYGDEPISKILIDRIGIRLSTMPKAVIPPFDPRSMTDSATHRGMDVEGYRGAPLR
jgi:hypothetical protein